ncbi:hypothetical protein ACH50O_23040 (plasmid) [Methylomonas sp. 2BW1-5-20]|uniref:hypothetical protein n=1 Tax=Methylomonas sp. 2BW1-5-20 TaxID=3376686 RepID=UPI00404F24F4
MSSYALLKEIEKRPVLFLGNPSIFNLSAFLNGYTNACVNHEKRMQKDEEFWNQFLKWIESRYCNFFDAEIKQLEVIMFITAGGDEHQALQGYFNNFENFLQECGSFLEKEENWQLTTTPNLSLMKRNNMDICEVFNEIQKRPALFLSTPSIFRLNAYLQGYFTACSNYGIAHQDRKVFGEFIEWLSNKYRKLKIADVYRWEQIMFIVSCHDEYEALKNFFVLFKAFIEWQKKS